MEKKIRIGFSIVVILGLLIPMNEDWPIGLAFYLITGTLMAVFEIIPALLSTPWILIQDISASPSLNSIKEILLYIPFQIGTLFWIYALPILFLWNLYLIKPRSSKIQNIYRVGLLVSQRLVFIVPMLTPYMQVPSLDWVTGLILFYFWLQRDLKYGYG